MAEDQNNMDNTERCTAKPQVLDRPKKPKQGAYFVDLNSASFNQLAQLPGIGPEAALAIAKNRPYENWADLKRIPGFTDATIETLQLGGAAIC